MSIDEPTLNIRPGGSDAGRLLITPERARWFRDACRWDPEVLAAVEALSRAPRDEGLQRAVLELLDRWQATDAPPGVRLSQPRLEDLRRHALDAGDETAYVVCSLALGPDEMCWIPNAREDAAAELCRVAWGARAARLRGLGILPLGGVAGAGGAS